MRPSGAEHDVVALADLRGERQDLAPDRELRAAEVAERIDATGRRDVQRVSVPEEPERRVQVATRPRPASRPVSRRRTARRVPRRCSPAVASQSRPLGSNANAATLAGPSRVHGRVQVLWSRERRTRSTSSFGASTSRSPRPVRRLPRAPSKHGGANPHEWPVLERRQMGPGAHRVGGGDAAAFAIPCGTITTADFAPAVTTVAGLSPNLIVAFSRPTPRSVTWAPGLPWFATSRRPCGHAKPAASGVPNPVARSKPGRFGTAPAWVRVRSVLPGRLDPEAVPVEAGRHVGERGAVHVLGGERAQLRREVADPAGLRPFGDVGGDAGERRRGDARPADGNPPVS